MWIFLLALLLGGGAAEEPRTYKVSSQPLAERVTAGYVSYFGRTVRAYTGYLPESVEYVGLQDVEGATMLTVEVDGHCNHKVDMTVGRGGIILPAYSGGHGGATSKTHDVWLNGSTVTMVHVPYPRNIYLGFSLPPLNEDEKLEVHGLQNHHTRVCDLELRVAYATAPTMTLHSNMTYMVPEGVLGVLAEGLGSVHLSGNGTVVADGISTPLPVNTSSSLPVYVTGNVSVTFLAPPLSITPVVGLPPFDTELIADVDAEGVFALPAAQVGGVWHISTAVHGVVVDVLYGGNFHRAAGYPAVSPNLPPLEYPQNTVTVRVSTRTEVVLHDLSTPCSDGCRGHGDCRVRDYPGVHVAACSCNRPYEGWMCAEYRHGTKYPPRFFLLVLSNMAFLPAILVGLLKRKAYVESLVYFLNMYASATYHMCDEDVVDLCYFPYPAMAFFDFYLSFASIWFTIIYLAMLSPPWKSLLHVLGLVGLALGATVNREDYRTIVVPFALAASVGFGMWFLHCLRAEGACRPRTLTHLWRSPRFYWIWFALGLILATLGFVDVAEWETTDNYGWTHSAWHVLIATSPAAFLLSAPRSDSVEKRGYDMSSEPLLKVQGIDDLEEPPQEIETSYPHSYL